MVGILTANTVNRAFDQVKPYIEATLNSGLTKRQHLAVVVSVTKAIDRQTHLKEFGEDDCYLVTGFGEKSAWKYDYAKIALSKAEKSVRTGKASGDLSPHYLREGDTIYWGSVVLDDIVVACSGVQPYYDEMFAMWIAAAIKAEAKRAFEEYREKNPNHDFITDVD